MEFGKPYNNNLHALDDHGALDGQPGSVIGEARWNNAFGESVDLDDINRVYALNILTLVLLRRGRAGMSNDEVRHDPLVSKLREVVLVGREPTDEDNQRAIAFNQRCAAFGLTHRAEIF